MLFCHYYLRCVCASGSVVEHLLAKEGVAGSIPVSRSMERLRNIIQKNRFIR